MTTHLQDYISTLLAHSEDTKKRREAELANKAQADAEQLAQRNSPLIDRLKRLIATLPDSERDQPRPLEFFAEQLKGRQKMTPHRGELAAALRKLGWRRTRCWRKSANGFRSLWYPPKGGE
ncbi:MAG: hypothetical protein WBX11_15230 [Thiobacillaceae bacterium]